MAIFIADPPWLIGAGWRCDVGDDELFCTLRRSHLGSYSTLDESFFLLPHFTVISTTADLLRFHLDDVRGLRGEKTKENAFLMQVKKQEKMLKMSFHLQRQFTEKIFPDVLTGLNVEQRLFILTPFFFASFHFLHKKERDCRH